LHAAQYSSAVQRDSVGWKQSEERHAEVRHAPRLALDQHRDDAGRSGRASRLPHRLAVEGVQGRGAGIQESREMRTWAQSARRLRIGGPSLSAVKAHGTFAESSKVMLTLTVFPGTTSIGSGLGGFLLYTPSEEPDGGGDCASQA